MREPRMIQGVPRVSEKARSVGQGERKPVAGGQQQGKGNLEGENVGGLRERINGLALNKPDLYVNGDGGKGKGALPPLPRDVQHQTQAQDQAGMSRSR